MKFSIHKKVSFEAEASEATEAPGASPTGPRSFPETIAARIPVIIGIVLNLVPLIGVIKLHWSILLIILLYWAESLIIGFFTIIKIALAQKSPTPPAKYLEAHPGYTPTEASRIGLKLFAIPFFMIHFGIFMLVHLMFIFFLIAPADIGSIQQFRDSLNGDSSFVTSILLSLLALFTYQLINFIFTYLRPKAYQETTPFTEMVHPYPRIFVTHLVILSSGFIMGMMQFQKLSPVIIAALLVFFKTAIDTRNFLSRS